jgi:hypothetical protein
MAEGDTRAVHVDAREAIGQSPLATDREHLGCGATARSCESTASSSWSALVISYRRRRFSAVSSIHPALGGELRRPSHVSARDGPLAVSLGHLRLAVSKLVAMASALQSGRPVAADGLTPHAACMLAQAWHEVEGQAGTTYRLQT